jgi:hypothetical protein
MQGVVFLEFLDMAAGRFGGVVLERALELAGLESRGEYEESESYDPRELPRLVGALAKQTGRPAPDLMRAFGRHLFSLLAQRQPGLVDGGTPVERWSRLSAMLPPAGPAASQEKGSGLPTFVRHASGADGLEVHYDVAKTLADLADEFVVAAGERLGPVAAKDVTADGATVHVRLSIG